MVEHTGSSLDAALGVLPLSARVALDLDDLGIVSVGTNDVPLRQGQRFQTDPVVRSEIDSRLDGRRWIFVLLD